MKNGVPWGVASSMSDEETLAACVVLGTFEGGKFDWRRMAWEARD